MTVTGKQFRRSDGGPINGDGNKTTHSRPGDGDRSRLTDREKISLLRGGVCHCCRHGALNNERNRIDTAQKSMIAMVFSEQKAATQLAR